MLWTFTTSSLSISDKPFAFFNFFCYTNGAAAGQPHSAFPEVELTMRHFQIDSMDTIRYHEMEPGFLFPGESLPAFKLTYVDQGQMHSVANGIDMVLQRGDLVICAPGHWHMQYADMDQAPRFITVTFRISCGDLTPLVNRKITLPQELTALLQKCLLEQDRMGQHAPDIITVSMELLLLLLLQRQAVPTQALKTPYALHAENEIIRRAQQYVSTHVRQKLSVPMVARQVDVSPSYLTALFHKHLEISPGEYIRRVKLQESKHLIREGKLNFTEIAAALNYSTVHHFSRQFKEKFGITPTDYAKSIK